MKTENCLIKLGINISKLKARGLIKFEEATELEIIETDTDGRNYLLTPQAATAWRMLRKKAEADKISIYIVSAFRSISLQEKIIRKKLDDGIKIDEILKVCAVPGYSEHHTGCAVDIGTLNLKPLEIDFETTKAFFWLTKNARKFGFSLSYPRGNKFGYQYEPWHWCFKEQP
ncbi:MAG: D-alanyl-D-alanine carboxypeptidase family protein [Candidatus Cloacimonetes bacterium]|nr:D-alanyl-D-alanine carboxypeptidase family protein [Candidatus Cloacimonadota bacterium]